MHASRIVQAPSTIRFLGRSMAARIRRVGSRWVRQCVGWAWLLMWAAVLELVHRPWHELGGLLSERMRWLERFVLGAAFLAGCFIGSFVRDASQSVRGRPHLDSLRFVWIPPAALAAVTMAASWHLDQWPWTLLVLTGFAAYWAGLDAAIGAWPLARGRHYSLTERIEADGPRDRAVREWEADD